MYKLLQLQRKQTYAHAMYCVLKEIDQKGFTSESAQTVHDLITEIDFGKD